MVDTTALEVDVKQNTRDISALTSQVTRIAAMVENQEDRRKEETINLREMASGIRDLNKRMEQILSIEKDVAVLKEMIAEFKGELRVLKHDMVNLKTAQQIIPMFQKEMSTIAAKTESNAVKIETIETLRDKLQGGATVITFGAKLFWLVCGGTVVGAITYLLQGYMGQTDNMYYSSSDTQVTIPNGEGNTHEGYTR